MNAAHLPRPEPRIAAFEKLGFGMFIHWGLYAQLGKGEWIQHMEQIPREEYARLKETFTAERFDARQIVGIARRSGMKYITLTARHHDGFSLYDTRGLNDYDALHSPAGRDLVGEFVEACREGGVLPILYHTTLDWYEPSFQTDFDRYLDYLNRSVELLCTRYGPIGGLWFDGNWSKPDADWKLDALYGLIRKHQPEALIINNTGMRKRGELVHPEIDSVTFEQARPQPMDRNGMSKYVAAEMCETINEHWGIGYADFKYKSLARLIENVCACRKVGANYLLNVGPTAEGQIVPLQQAMLEAIGEWLQVNGRPIYDGKPSKVQGEGEDFALETEDGKLYLFIHRLKIGGHDDVTVGGGGTGERRFVGLQRPIGALRWLDNGEALSFEQDEAAGTLRFHATGYPYGVNYVVRVAEAELG